MDKLSLENIAPRDSIHEFLAAETPQYKAHGKKTIKMVSAVNNQGYLMQA